MKQSANTSGAPPLEHDINTSCEPRTELLDFVSTPAAADWKPRAHLELMNQWRQRSFFGRPICASRPRLGSGRLLPRRGKSQAPSCWRTRTAGRGVYAIEQRNGNARYLVAALQMEERTNLLAPSYA